MKILLRATFAAALLAAAFLVACGDDEKTASKGHVNNSPADCIKGIATSWNNMDYYRFKPCLSPDFVFYFNPNDVGMPAGNGYIIPTSWNYVEMLNSARDMFNQAYSIDMGISAANVGTPGADDTTWRAEHVAVAFTLMLGPGNGYRVGAGYCDFEFERYVDDGEYRWRLAKWWDYTRESKDSVPTSLGRILALYK